MNLTSEQQKELARFPAVLRALIEAELAAGNPLIELGHGHPAPPVGAYALFAQKIRTRPRASGNGLAFHERQSSLHSGEFTDDQRFFFVLEAPNPPPMEPDMDAIRKAHEPKPDPLTPLSQRHAGSGTWATPADTPAPKADAPMRPPQAVAQALTHVETSTGWTRLLHFSDPRPPHEVQFALERELMALFNAGMVGSRLRLNATAHVHGARYDFELSYVAALKSTNHFSLLTTASWAGCDAKNVDYYRKSSDGWFQLWTRDLMSANPPAVEENLSDAYGKFCQPALQAQHAFHSVTSVQHAIIDGLKRGGRFGTSHKEGGTNIFWQAGKFVRSDYGDYPGGQKFTDEGEFLKMLWNFSQFEVTRHAGKQGLPELDAWKLILRSMSAVAPPHPENMRGGGIAGGSSALTGMVAATPKLGVSAGWPLHSSPLAIGFMIGVLLLLGLGMAAWQFVSIKSTGTPLGQALGTPTHIFHLISTTERFLPKLHRPPGKDRFRIDLLVVPIADPSHPETFTLLRQQQSNALAPMARILGVEGDVVWIQALDTFAVNLRTHRVAREEDLRKANPELGNFLQSAGGILTAAFSPFHLTGPALTIFPPPP